jgi:hypothetical protein
MKKNFELFMTVFHFLDHMEASVSFYGSVVSITSRHLSAFTSHEFVAVLVILTTIEKINFNIISSGSCTIQSSSTYIYCIFVLLIP